VFTDLQVSMWLYQTQMSPSVWRFSFVLYKRNHSPKTRKNPKYANF
jgi:hypothetical protein